MAIKIYYANSNKRRLSTFQFQTVEANSIDVTLKEDTSIDEPTFIVSANWIGWNVCKWSDRYYFVDEVISIGNGLWEVRCIIDVLATFKSYILSSTQYVSYSSQSGGTWLPDTRIPSVTNSVVSSVGDTDLDFIDYDGFYTLAVIGDNGCELFGVTQTDIALIIDRLNTWKTDSYNAIKSNADGQFVYDWVNNPQESGANFSMATAFLSASWSNAANCLRSCTWVPFKRSYFQVGGAKNIKLGDFITVVNTKALSGKAVNVATFNVSIPWRFNDWRRVTNENAYIYLPFVGVISLPNGDINQCTQIRVDISVNAIDGSIQYQLKGDVSGYLGNYVAKVGCEYPIGLNQGHSPIDTQQTIINNRTNLVSAVNSLSLFNPVTWLTTGANYTNAMSQSQLNYEKNSVERTATVIGTFGASSVCSGLYNKVRIWTVSQDTIISPGNMKATMGVPTMKPLQLSNLTGYCQCANAHVECPGSAREKAAVDTALNSGFFIE